MKLIDVAKAGYKAARKTAWNDKCYMAFYYSDDRLGVWGHIVDPVGSVVVGQPENARIPLLLLHLESVPSSGGMDDDDWEPFLGEILQKGPLFQVPKR